MQYTATEIAEIINGEIKGDPDTIVSYLAKIEEGKKGGLCFLGNKKYTPYIYETKASIIIVDKNFKLDHEISPTLIYVDNAYNSFSKLLDIYNKMKFDKNGIDSLSKIEDSVKIGKNVYVGPFSYIGNNVILGDNVKIQPNCFIGDNVTVSNNSILYAGVKIYHDCLIGKNNIIHSGVVIGADGFGFSPNTDNEFCKISQIGNVILENDIEIGANTTIDRATMGSTMLRKGVKLDNLIQIGHNVEIGKNTVIASKVAIAGSTKIGDDCMIGGQSAIAGHISIANKVKIAGQSGIASSIKKEGAVVQGPLAFDIKDFQRSYIIFKRLPEIYKTITEIKKHFLQN
tara:strand:- start:6737 stop:7765 length:1029 start_codon:yes stop_codon:yes gene_type:complete